MIAVSPQPTVDTGLPEGHTGLILALMKRLCDAKFELWGSQEEFVLCYLDMVRELEVRKTLKEMLFSKIEKLEEL